MEFISNLLDKVRAVMRGGQGTYEDGGETASREAAGRDYVNEVERLLSKGGDVNAKDAAGCTALHRAAWDGSPDLVTLLLSKGADVNAKNNDGHTALHLAARRGHLAVAGILRKSGGTE